MLLLLLLFQQCQIAGVIDEYILDSGDIKANALTVLRIWRTAVASYSKSKQTGCEK